MLEGAGKAARRSACVHVAARGPEPATGSLGTHGEVGGGEEVRGREREEERKGREKDGKAGGEWTSRRKQHLPAVVLKQPP